MAILVAAALVIGATAAILRLGTLAARAPFAWSRLEYVNTQAKYQALLLCLAMCVLVVLYLVNEGNFLAFFAAGNIAAPAGAVSWLSIPGGVSWLGLGAGILFFATCGTSAFVYLQFRRSGGSLTRLIPFMPWVLLFSVTNAFSEEVVYRLGVIVPLFGTVDTAYLLLISAAAFGAPHLRGMPNGIVGALMAGLLGWFLAKSVVETNGVLWAWFIHGVQDVVVFSAFVMAAENRTPPPADTQDR